jgi:hypothetical protein
LARIQQTLCLAAEAVSLKRDISHVDFIDTTPSDVFDVIALQIE